LFPSFPGFPRGFVRACKFRYLFEQEAKVSYSGEPLVIAVRKRILEIKPDWWKYSAGL